MALERIFSIAASAMTAQSQRLNVVASNLANAESVAGPDGKPYKARQVVFTSQTDSKTPGGVAVTNIVESDVAAKRDYDPKHPLADAQGYVTYSNVNAIEEMVNMISASRSYQNNVEIMNTTQQLMMKTLQLGQ